MHLTFLAIRNENMNNVWNEGTTNEDVSMLLSNY